jgi:hypothetical protein
MLHWRDAVFLPSLAAAAAAAAASAAAAGGKPPPPPPPPPPLHCSQPAGSLLYVPEGWHHGTLNEGETLAVARQDRMAR